jgi:hypothetical protein
VSGAVGREEVDDDAAGDGFDAADELWLHPASTQASTAVPRRPIRRLFMPYRRSKAPRRLRLRDSRSR